MQRGSKDNQSELKNRHHWLINEQIDILDHLVVEYMPTWNCKRCDMPMTTMDVSNTMACPHCHKAMVRVSD